MASPQLVRRSPELIWGAMAAEDMSTPRKVCLVTSVPSEMGRVTASQLVVGGATASAYADSLERLTRQRMPRAMTWNQAHACCIWEGARTMTGVIATAEAVISASPGRVWAALTDPAQIKEYMFGSEVETDWIPGSSITWKGKYQGKAYEDKGKIVELDPPRRLVVTHFSPMSGQEDIPENYHTLTYLLEPRGEGTHVSLSQDNNASNEEAAHSRDNWAAMLSALKNVIEGR